MGSSANERVAYVNGAIVPENEAVVSIRDQGLVYGDSVFDTARTFGGKLFKLAEHVDRLYESLAYVRIDPGMSKAEMIAATEQVLQANLPALRDGEDYWVTQRVTSGPQTLDGEDRRNSGATVAIDCIPLPLRSRATSFRDGITTVVAARRRIAPDALSPNTKTNNYLNMMLAQREVQALQPGAWALMCDKNGDLAEGPGCNFFAVKDGTVYTPTTEYILAGISRGVVIDLCGDLGIPLRETSVPLQLAMTAQEAFFSSTSLCVCGVASLNGVTYSQAVPGPVTERIMKAFSDLVGFDYVGQYLKFLGTAPTGTGL